MPKFFIDTCNISGNSVKIYGSDVKHITKVLRLKTQSILILCDGEGYDYVAKLAQIDDDSLSLDILEKKPCTAEPNLKVTLFQGFPKAGKMEYIIEKCTELGISSIVPVITERTVVKFDENDSGRKKLERFRKVASESVKQCARGKIPEISNIYSLKQTEALIKDLDLIIVAYENERETSLKSVLKENKNVSSIGIFIGPEGGFAEDEINFLTSLGAKKVTLGNRILRTETAGQAVLSAVMYEYNEMQ
ncbi:MAG: 16S rRNA (uracil(1498)-N(3))-methyltransferase [Clostridia bacterium]|nr:16S rRNA (uracil(1498)-N(3))-methyltransferase [Clostridia bacterium]